MRAYRMLQITRSWIFVVALAAVMSAAADTRRAGADLQLASPETVGFSLERLKRLDAAMQAAVDRGQFAGVVTLAARHGKLIHTKAYGQQDIASAKPMSTNAIFRIYSMTKSVIGVAMMILYEEGKWHPDDPVTKFVPQFADLKVFTGLDAKGKPILEAPRHPPTMGELMTHTAGFAYGVFGDTWVDQQYEKDILSRQDFVFKTANLQELIDKLARIPLLHQPGTRWEYSLAVDVQAYIIERLSGRPVPDFLRERIFRPLGMRDTDYFVPADKLSRLATLYQFDAVKKALVVRDQPPDPAALPSMTPGGFGVYSTAIDILRFAQMLLNRGELDGVRILAPRTVDLMRSDQLSDAIRNAAPAVGPRLVRPGIGFGYDFGVHTDPFLVGALSGTGTFYWAGAAGTWFWIDPQFDLVFVGMTHTWFDLSLIEVARATFYQALVDPEE
ncbi:MAG TPA: serine hydrolase domain-containing protein [Steroidobacteraceae bacterium]|nr:serine hydrolase domain-containing protein [Steroidobacteraceae bacterium]